MSDDVRAPREVVAAAQAYSPGPRIIRAVIIGHVVGLLCVALFVVVGWWAAGAVVVMFAFYACWHLSEAAAYRSCERTFRQQMTRAGWCAWCYGPHRFSDCPDR